MNEPLRIKLTRDIITDLHAFHRLNAVREMKKMAEDTISYAKEHFGKVYDGYQIEFGHHENGVWTNVETLTPERLDEVEKEIDAITEESRLKLLEALLQKMKLIEEMKSVDVERTKVTGTRLGMDQMELVSPTVVAEHLQQFVKEVAK